MQVLDVKDPPPGRCLNTMVYIADVTGFGIIAYDAQSNRSWRIQNKLFYPHPNFGTHTIAGESFDLMDGVFGLALSPYTYGNIKSLFCNESQYYKNQKMVRFEIVNCSKSSSNFHVNSAQIEFCVDLQLQFRKIYNILFRYILFRSFLHNNIHTFHL